MGSPLGSGGVLGATGGSVGTDVGAGVGRTVVGGFCVGSGGCWVGGGASLGTTVGDGAGLGVGVWVAVVGGGGVLVGVATDVGAAEVAGGGWAATTGSAGRGTTLVSPTPMAMPATSVVARPATCPTTSP
ncbi:MAG TPA: hypothetical protein VFY88_16760, partial [Intrasporangium sp.]|nr:hypothetical protein [Intrasporangium sp.]